MKAEKHPAIDEIMESISPDGTAQVPFADGDVVEVERLYVAAKPPVRRRAPALVEWFASLSPAERARVDGVVAASSDSDGDAFDDVDGEG